MLKRILYLLSFVLIAGQMFAQVTTSSITGVIKGANGETLVGATVTATHIPTGSIYRTVSRVGGRFDLNNLNPGGPYTIDISYVGHQTFSRSEIFLNLGETERQDFELTSSQSQLTEVVVATSRRPGGSKGGTETNIGRDKMANLPTVGRNANDFVRYTP